MSRSSELRLDYEHEHRRKRLSTSTNVESLPELFAWKKELLPQLDKTPYVDGESPVVCAWYPTARAVLLWNLSQQRQDLTLRYGSAHRSVDIKGLDVALVEDLEL